MVQDAREVAKQDTHEIKGMKRIDGVSCAGWLGIGALGMKVIMLLLRKIGL